MDIEVRPLAEAELDDADKILRDAFGTFVGADIFRDSDLLRTRIRAGNTVVLAAVRGGELVGSNVVTRWGSVGFFGPLSVTPALWDHGVGAALVRASMPVFEAWGTTHQGLFTFAHSPKHHGLYQKFDFWPGRLTVIMSRAADPAAPRSGAPVSADRSTTASCAELAGTLYPGLDLTGEIDAVLDHGLGDVVVTGDPARPDAFAICHSGPGTEAGSGVLFVKFGAVRAGGGARGFAALLDAVAGQAAAAGAERIVAGVNLARHEAYRHLLGAGFRTDFPGVSMHSGDRPGYDARDAYVIDDWR